MRIVRYSNEHEPKRRSKDIRAVAHPALGEHRIEANLSVHYHCGGRIARYQKHQRHVRVVFHLAQQGTAWAFFRWLLGVGPQPNVTGQNVAVDASDEQRHTPVFGGRQHLTPPISDRGKLPAPDEILGLKSALVNRAQRHK